MSARIQRLATDWKLYVALLFGTASAALSAIPDFFNKVKDAVAAFHGLPEDARWIAVGLLGVLGRCVARLSNEERAPLGATGELGAGDVFGWLSTLPSNAPRQLLVVIDQIDDYFVAHRGHCLIGRKVITPEDLEKLNSDWAALA